MLASAPAASAGGSEVVKMKPGAWLRRKSTSAAEPVRKQLDRILASPGFVRNGRLSRFLRFVVQQALDTALSFVEPRCAQAREPHAFLEQPE